MTCLKEFVRLRRAQNAIPHVFSSSTMSNEWPKFCAQLVSYMASHVGPEVLKGSSQMLECLSTLIQSLASFNVEDTNLLDLLSLCVQLLVAVLYVVSLTHHSNNDTRTLEQSTGTHRKKN